MSEQPYVRRKASLIVQLLTAINTWHGLTRAQKRDLLAAPCAMSPRVRERLYTMRLIRKDGRRTVWGERVVQVAAPRPAMSREETP